MKSEKMKLGYVAAAVTGGILTYMLLTRKVAAVPTPQPEAAWVPPSPGAGYAEYAYPNYHKLLVASEYATPETNGELVFVD